MRKETIICDNCGTVKKETNNWLIVLFHREMTQCNIAPTSCWKDFPDSIGRFDVCGKPCAFELISKNLK
jgi:hypothetical protein